MMVILIKIRDWDDDGGGLDQYRDDHDGDLDQDRGLG